jgi:hypothetical protein
MSCVVCASVAGNIVALLHSFFSNLPQEWLESTHTVIKHLRPVNSVAMLRIAFRILGPLLPRLAFARPLFMKVYTCFSLCGYSKIKNLCYIFLFSFKLKAQPTLKELGVFLKQNNN